MAATGTPRLSTYSTPATPAARSQSMAPGAQTALQTTAPTPAAAAASASAQQQQQQRQQAPPLPPPAVFDILPHLHALLNRLLIQKPTDASHAQQQHQGEDGSKPHGDSNSSNASAAAKGVGGSGGGGGGGGGGTGAAAAASATATTALPSDPDAQPLEIHQLTAASSALKVRLQKARQAVARLGDVDRTVDEQREEMAELEERVRKLRAVLQDMGVATAAAGEAKGLVTVGGNGSGGGGGDGGNDLVLRVPRPV